MLEVYLHGAGYTVIGMGDGMHATRYAMAHPPDVVITDISLPGLDGFEVLAALKGNPGTADVPVIITSASIEPGQRWPEEAHQADAVISKHIRPADLLGTVKRLLTKKASIA